jgi:hypothetical protein
MLDLPNSLGPQRCNDRRNRGGAKEPGQGIERGNARRHYNLTGQNARLEAPLACLFNLAA